VLGEDYEINFELITTSKTNSSSIEWSGDFSETISRNIWKDDFDATITVIDDDEIKRRYDIALEVDNPLINYDLNLADCKFLNETIAGTQVFIAAVPLQECIKFPGIKDGSLFQKNVRQSLWYKYCCK
jgi:hypothetical protein